MLAATVPGHATRHGLIAYMRGTELHVMRDDGKGDRLLSSHGAPFVLQAGAPSWSPDGRSIAFTLGIDHCGMSGSRIAVVSVGGSTPRVLNRGAACPSLGIGEEDDPAWSPDGRSIAFEEDGDIWVMSADGSHARRITLGPYPCTSPAWSPDGARIAYVALKHRYGGRGQIFVMNANGSDQRRLVSDAGSDTDPAWSPDGQSIAFAHDAWTNGLPGLPTIWVTRADGSGGRSLRRRGSQPAWSPDGKRIVFAGTGGSEGALHVIDADGSHDTTPGFNFIHPNVAPAWQPSG
jgi:Tol biopolymer transport system component